MHYIELFHEEVVFLLELQQLGTDLGLEGLLVAGVVVFELFSFEQVGVDGLVEFDQFLLFEGGQFGCDLLEVGDRQVAER